MAILKSGTRTISTGFSPSSPNPQLWPCNSQKVNLHRCPSLVYFISAQSANRSDRIDCLINFQILFLGCGGGEKHPAWLGLPKKIQSSQVAKGVNLFFNPGGAESNVPYKILTTLHSKRGSSLPSRSTCTFSVVQPWPCYVW